MGNPRRLDDRRQAGNHTVTVELVDLCGRAVGKSDPIPFRTYDVAAGAAAHVTTRGSLSACDDGILDEPTLFLVSDVDEIASAEVIAEIKYCMPRGGSTHSKAWWPPCFSRARYMASCVTWISKHIPSTFRIANQPLFAKSKRVSVFQCLLMFGAGAVEERQCSKFC